MNEELFMPDSYPPEADWSSSYARGAQAPSRYNYSSSRAIINEEFFNSGVQVTPEAYRLPVATKTIKRLYYYTVNRFFYFRSDNLVKYSADTHILLRAGTYINLAV